MTDKEQENWRVATDATARGTGSGSVGQISVEGEELHLFGIVGKVAGRTGSVGFVAFARHDRWDLTKKTVRFRARSLEPQVKYALVLQDVNGQTGGWNFQIYFQSKNETLELIFEPTHARAYQRGVPVERELDLSNVTRIGITVRRSIQSKALLEGGDFPFSLWISDMVVD